MMTKKQHKLQRLFDTAIPATCGSCGMLIALAQSKNGTQCRYDLDDKSNPTFQHHVCPVAAAKVEARKRVDLGANA